MQQLNKKRNWFASSMAVLLFLALMTGCSGGQTAGNSAEPDSSAKPESNSQTSTPGTGKADIGYPETLTYYTILDANAAAVIKNYSEMKVYKKLEEITGTKVTFEHPSVGGHEPLNLMLTSGKLPDVIEWRWDGLSRGPDSYIKEKRIIRLNELIEKYAPNLSKYLADNPKLDALSQRMRATSTRFRFYAAMNICRHSRER
ncbi:hypothetical protein [Paenibacillus sp. GCM10027626]|uniref:hypothetical protein n=1 Tax=Paenibacillus sp. GCM10027626 TaxID=3273411 RepID=UPI0036438503